MTKRNAREYFIVKHGLDSLLSLPDCIWNTEVPSTRLPMGYGTIKPGSRWISFAYTDSDRQEEKMSLVTGFSECVEERDYVKIPLRKRVLDDIAGGATHGWIIRGKPFGEKLQAPVAIPPIRHYLEKPPFTRATITGISESAFTAIYKDVLRRHLGRGKLIPLLGREPKTEQELLGVIAHDPARFGIKRIHRMRTKFPDLLVELEGCKDLVHLELELCSRGFFAHKHHLSLRRDGWFEDKDDVPRPVAVACWIDDDKKVSASVHKVFELQTLLRAGKKMRW